jgi:hypothetical protein
MTILMSERIKKQDFLITVFTILVFNFFSSQCKKLIFFTFFCTWTSSCECLLEVKLAVARSRWNLVVFRFRPFYGGEVVFCTLCVRGKGAARVVMYIVTNRNIQGVHKGAFINFRTLSRLLEIME